MTLNEVAERREGFRRGEPIIGRDGSHWFLPPIEPESYDQFPELQKFYDALVEPKAFETKPGTNFPYFFVSLMNLFYQMVEANYHVTCDQLLAIVTVDEGTIDARPIYRLLELLDSHGTRFRAYRIADSNGTSRKDMLALLESPATGLPLRGWFKHDGCLFKN